jgi:hypothetical protein
MRLTQSANSIARALEENRKASPKYPQNPDRRIGTVLSTYNPAGVGSGLVPVIFDGEDTAVNIQAGTHAFANDRVGINRRGASWAIEANYTTPRLVISRMKTSATSRSTQTLSADPDISLTLPTGTWLVEIDFVWSAGNTGKLATTWTVPADTASSVRQAMGPGQSSVSGDNRNAGSTSRWGSHFWATSIAFAGSGDTSYMTHREWGSVSTVTGGTVTLNWARLASDTPATTLYEGTTIRATRII